MFTLEYFDISNGSYDVSNLMSGKWNAINYDIMVMGIALKNVDQSQTSELNIL